MALHGHKGRKPVAKRVTGRKRPTLPSQASPKARAAVAKKRPRR